MLTFTPKTTLLTTKVECRGCQKQEIIEFSKPVMFLTTVIPFTCKKCGSKNAAHVNKSLFKNQLRVKVNMIQHTKTLLHILNKRKKSAKNISKR